MRGWWSPPLVSLDGIAELRGITASADGGLRIGAMTRHRETAGEARLAGSLALVRQAAGVIANPVVRNMGTIGGSIAFADPAADYPPALVAADAAIEIAACRRRPAPSRREILSRLVHDGAGARRDGHGDPSAAVDSRQPRSTASSPASAATSPSPPWRCATGRSTAVRIAVGGCGPTPLRARRRRGGARRSPRGSARGRRSGSRCWSRHADPVDDVRGSADYRRRLIPRLLAAALADLRDAREAAVMEAPSGSDLDRQRPATTAYPSSGADTLLTVLRDQLAPHRRQARLQPGRLRRLHRRDRRLAGARLPVAWPPTAKAARSPPSRAAGGRSGHGGAAAPFVERGAVQCGFCTPGMLISARRLLARYAASRRSTRCRPALSGNLCRCTGYRKIVDAVLAAAAELAP